MPKTMHDIVKLCLQHNNVFVNTYYYEHKDDKLYEQSEVDQLQKELIDSSDGINVRISTIVSLFNNFKELK